jgi:gas vesicle protein
MSKSSSSTGSIIVAFALGALAGAAVALLYAPMPGDETRRRLAETAREGRERAEAAAQRGGEIYRQQRQNLNEAIDRGVEAFHEARKDAL